MLASANWPTAGQVRFHTVSVPVMAEPRRWPTAPTVNATSIDGAATRTRARALASTMRSRWGTSVNVVSPLRWVHSAVTERTAMTGRTIEIGMPMASVNVWYVSSSAGENAMTAPMVSRARPAMLARSQSPEVVSNDLRSSTITSRRKGMRRRCVRTACCGR